MTGKAFTSIFHPPLVLALIVSAIFTPELHGSYCGSRVLAHEVRLSTSARQEIKVVKRINGAEYRLKFPTAAWRVVLAAGAQVSQDTLSTPPHRSSRHRLGRHRRHQRHSKRESTRGAKTTSLMGEQERTNQPPSSEESRERSPEGMGVLTGAVQKGPLSPIVGGEGTPSPPPPAYVSGVKIIISRADGQGLKSVVTDGRGTYRISLPAGAYRITMAPLLGGEFTKDLPADVSIKAGQTTRLDIHLDTGIR